MRRPIFARAFVAAMVVAAWPVSAAPAQEADRLLGRVVSEVRIVSGGQAVRDAQLEGLVEIRAGQPLAMGAVRETIVHLMGMGRFLDIRVSAFEAGENARVEIDLVPLRDVRRLIFTGALGLPEATLHAAVVDRFGSAPAYGRALDIARATEDLLKRRGYLRAVVTPGGRGADESRGDLVFDVASGPRARVRSVQFQHEPGEDAGELQSRLTLKPGDAYDRVELERQLSAAEERWHAQGYLEARARHDAEESDNGDAVDVTISFARGPHVTVRADFLTPRQRADLVPVEREGSADEDLLEDSQMRIEDSLRAQGYRDASARFVRELKADELHIVFTVNKGPVYRVAGVALEGAALVPRSELAPLLRLAVGQPFVQARLDADVAALVAEYRRRGFGSASVKAETEPVPGARTAVEAPVEVILRIAEGPRTLVSAVEIDGNTALTDAQLQAGLVTRVGGPLFEPEVTTDRDRLLLEYLNLGYRLVRIDAATDYARDRTSARVRFTVHEGPQVFVDHVLIVGNDRVGEKTIRRELVLLPGQPLGLQAVTDSQRKLAALGLFRRVTISELQHDSDTRRDVLVSVEESPATTLGYGGGVEFQKVETTEFAPRGFVEIGRRNLWGKNRSVNLFTRVSLRRHTQTVAATATEPAVDTTKTMLEYRVIGSYREPRVAGSTADLQAALAFEQGSRTSFSFTHRSARVSLTKRYGPTWTMQGQYSIGRDTVFDDNINPLDRPLIFRLFPEVRIGSVSGSAVRNTRDDTFDPGRGGLIGLNLELALRPIGSEVGFAKTFLQGFIYRQLPSSRRIVVAGGARLGLGTGFPREATVPGPDGDPILGPDGQPLTTTVRDLPPSERYFAGGDTTVRGFQLDRLGRHDTFDRDGTPIGGHAEVILNGEVRVAMWKDIGLVGFLDTGNVFLTVNDFALSKLRVGTGFGIRYKSPVGPIRFDFGFKVGTLQTFGTTREDRFALHISIGQAF